MRYLPFGETRWASGELHTDRRFTGQRWEAGLGGLYDYGDGTRFYSPALGRFISPDSLVPDPLDPQSYNRYSYALNAPTNYIDPSGHWVESALDIAFIGYDLYDISQNGLNWENGLSLAADVIGLALPVVTGGGLAVRAVSHMDDAVDAVRAIDRAGDAAQFANSADNVVRGVMGKADDAAAPIANKLDEVAGAACSFSADTPVATESGERAISMVQVGEHVLAYDEATGVTGYYTVTAVWAHEDPVVTYVAVDGEVIEATPEHPFYTPLHGWVSAGELWPGVLVRDATGEYASVQWVQSVARTQPMWDLTVDVAHTFFVGDGQWLVHNACLNKNLGGIAGDKKQAHHLIGQKFENHPLVKLAKKAGWEHNGAYNGILLPDNPKLAQQTNLPVHEGYGEAHRAYNDMVGQRLDQIWWSNSRWTAVDAKKALFNLARQKKYQFYAQGTWPR